MKQILFTLFFSFILFSILDAQTPEVISELTPLPSNAKKFSKNLPLAKHPIVHYKINFNAIVKTLTLPDGKKALSVIIQTTNEEMSFESNGNKIVARIAVYGQIISKDKKTKGFFENNLIIKVADENEYKKIAKNPVIFHRIFKLPEGKYKLGVTMRDEITGNGGIRFIKFEIPGSQ